MGEYINSFSFEDIAWRYEGTNYWGDKTTVTLDPYAEGNPIVYMNNNAYLYSGQGRLLELDIQNGIVHRILKSSELRQYGNAKINGKGVFEYEIYPLIAANNKLYALAKANGWYNLIKIDVESSSTTLIGKVENQTANLLMDGRIFSASDDTIKCVTYIKIYSGSSVSYQKRLYDAATTGVFIDDKYKINILEYNIAENKIISQKEIDFSAVKADKQIATEYNPVTNKLYAAQEIGKKNTTTGFTDLYTQIYEYDPNYNSKRMIAEIKALNRGVDIRSVGDYIYFISSIKVTNSDSSGFMKVTGNHIFKVSIKNGTAKGMPVTTLPWAEYNADLFNLYGLSVDQDKLIPYEQILKSHKAVGKK